MTSITLTFDQSVIPSPEGGVIRIVSTQTGESGEDKFIIPVNDTKRVKMSSTHFYEDTVTITLSLGSEPELLDVCTLSTPGSYHIVIDEGAFMDAAGNLFAGVNVWDDECVGNFTSIAACGQKKVIGLVRCAVENSVQIYIFNSAVCFFAHNLRCFTHLTDADHLDFSRAEQRVWHTSTGSVGGLVRSAGNLTFAVIVAAGHLVPMNQPVASLDMVRDFIRGTL